MYALLPPSEPLSQGDILDGCPLVFLDPTTDYKESTLSTARVIVLTQACDLAQGRRNHAVVAVVHEAQWLVARGILKAQAVRDQIRRGQTFGWVSCKRVADLLYFRNRSSTSANSTPSPSPCSNVSSMMASGSAGW